MFVAFMDMDVSAQYTFYVSGKNHLNMETQESVGSEPTEEVFNISFPDAVMAHNILGEEGVSDSQFYKITEVEYKDDLILFSTLSGVSGNSYYYVIQLHDGNYLLYQMFKEDNSAVLFDATMIKLKTVSQE